MVRYNKKWYCNKSAVLHDSGLQTNLRYDILSLGVIILFLYIGFRVQDNTENRIGRDFVKRKERK